MRVSVCVGKYAETPYCIPGLGMHVYCMEELCYCLKENAFLLDLSLMDDGLLKWMAEECGRKELARALHPLVHKKGSLSAFVAAILNDTGFYDRETAAQVQQALKQGAGLSRIEKRKSQVDYLVKEKKYTAAIREYDRLLENWAQQEKEGEPLPAVSCLAAIRHNRGVAYAGLMLYGRAADCFLEAWQTDGSKESYREYLAAKRMELPEEAYVAFAAEHTERYQDTLELEKEIDALGGQWEQQPEYLQLFNRREARQRGELQKYYEESGRAALTLKENYRSCADN